MSWHMDERKRSILKAITDDYIYTAEPVGSGTIAKKYSLGISPATIRNEMAGLEEEGYLEQPHTSAGRVPSNKGYRYYVDALLKKTDITSFDQSFWNEFQKNSNEIDSAIRAAIKYLSEMSGYVALAVVPVQNEKVLKQINLVQVASNELLILVVFTSNSVEYKVIAVDVMPNAMDIEKTELMLNKHLLGKRLCDIDNKICESICVEIRSWQSLIKEVIELLCGKNDSRADSVYKNGTMNMLEHPEFKEIENVKPILNFLGTDSEIYDLMVSLGVSDGLRVSIGEENLKMELKKCSIVGAPYMQNGCVIGMIGLVGPTRLNYKKALGLVDFATYEISRFISNKRFI